MESWGTPTSTVRMPHEVARMGPMVEPQATSLRTTNFCVGTLLRRAISSMRKPLKPDVA